MNPLRDEDLSALLDGELPPDRAAAVAAWADDDPDRRARLVALRAVRQHVRDVGPIEAPARFDEAVFTRLDAADVPLDAEAPVRPWTAAAVAQAVGLAAVALLVLRLALPQATPEADAPRAATDPFADAPAASVDAASSAVLLPETLVVATDADLATLRAAVTHGGGTLEARDDGYVIRLSDPRALEGVRRALADLGAVRTAGDPHAARDDAEVRLVTE